jgi:nitrogen fixation NifU-like protein
MEMDRETRIAWLVDHATRPRHAGALPDADISVPGGNPGCGDLITLYLKADPAEDRVAAVSFEGTGCTLSQAAASILTERTNKQRPAFAEVLDFTYEQMMELVGRMSPIRVRAAPRWRSAPQGRRQSGGNESAAQGRRPHGRRYRRAASAIAAAAEGTGLVIGEGAEQAARGA